MTPQSYPFATAWRDYVQGGAEKWLFLLVVMSSMQMPTAVLQFFYDQVRDMFLAE